MAKRTETLKDFTSCFVVLSRMEKVDLRLDDLLIKYLDYLKEKDNSDRFLILKVSDLADLLMNLDRLNVVSKRHVKLGLRKLLFLKLKVINNPSVKKKIVVKKLSTPKRIVSRPGKMKEVEKDIIEFVQSKDKVRSLDIINHFGVLHPRSVKRHLSNLVKGGYIHKETKGRAVFYFKQ